METPNNDVKNINKVRRNLWPVAGKKRKVKDDGGAHSSVMKRKSRALQELNAIQLKKLIYFKDMEIGKDFQVLCAERCDTKYGKNIMLELDDGMLFLPKRYEKMSDEALEELNTGDVSIKVVEVCGKSHNITFSHSSANVGDTNEDDDDDDDDIMLTQSALHPTYYKK